MFACIEFWKIFSEFKFTKKIGSGGFGEVWQGEWAGNDVAIKKILKTDIFRGGNEFHRKRPRNYANQRSRAVHCAIENFQISIIKKVRIDIQF